MSKSIAEATCSTCALVSWNSLGAARNSGVQGVACRGGMEPTGGVESRPGWSGMGEGVLGLVSEAHLAVSLCRGLDMVIVLAKTLVKAWLPM